MTRTPEHPLAPSVAKLNRATLIAFAVAMVLLVTIVLPAEYGRDPTGIGRLLGLTPMGEMKAADAAADAAAESATAPVATSTISEIPAEPVAGASPTAQPTAAASATPVPTPTASATPKAEATKAAAPAARRGEVTLTLAPNEGREVKALMKAGDSFRYEWSTGGPEVRFELHGEKVNAADGDFSSYEKGSSAGANGSFTAPFDGTHGWYWRNRTDQPVTITVRATGVFQTFAAK